MTSWHGYPSSYALGHKALVDLLLDPVLVEEKIDGSQFSFGVFDGALKFRSKGSQIFYTDQGHSSEKMFEKAVQAVMGMTGLREGWTYRAEYLAKPKHNVLAYDRVPKQHLIIFDVNIGEEDYLGWDDKAAEADRLGLEVVPRMFRSLVTDIGQIRALLDTVSVLGGQKVEGVVVKNYARFGLDKKVLIGKYVSEAYKEVHASEWRTANPNSGDIVQALGNALRTPARWNKSIQHLTEAGRLEGSPRDIGLLFKDVPDDIEKECADEIKEKLYAWAWPKIRRIATAGLAEHYKKLLLDAQPTAGAVEHDGTQGPSVAG